MAIAGGPGASCSVLYKNLRFSDQTFVAAVQNSSCRPTDHKGSDITRPQVVLSRMPVFAVCERRIGSYRPLHSFEKSSIEVGNNQFRRISPDMREMRYLAKYISASELAIPGLLSV